MFEIVGSSGIKTNADVSVNSRLKKGYVMPDSFLTQVHANVMNHAK